VALALEAVVADLIVEAGMLLRDGRDGGFDARLEVSDALARKEREPEMREALPGDGRRPVAAADHADIEVDGMRIFGVEGRADRVELGLEAAQRGDDRGRRLDRVRSFLRAPGVRGRAEHADREPEDADLRVP